MFKMLSKAKEKSFKKTNSIWTFNNKMNRIKHMWISSDQNTEKKWRWGAHLKLIDINTQLPDRRLGEHWGGEDAKIVRTGIIGTLLGVCLVDLTVKLLAMISQQCSCLNIMWTITALVDMPKWVGEISQGSTSRWRIAGS